MDCFINIFETFESFVAKFCYKKFVAVYASSVGSVCFPEPLLLLIITLFKSMAANFLGKTVGFHCFF